MKTKMSYSMLMDPKLYSRLDRESKRLKLSKVKIICIALEQLFESKKLDLRLN